MAYTVFGQFRTLKRQIINTHKPLLNNDLIDIANIIGIQAEELFDIVDKMKAVNLIETVQQDT